MEKKVIVEEVDTEEIQNYSFMIQKLFAVILGKSNVSKADKEYDRAADYKKGFYY